MAWPDGTETIAEGVVAGVITANQHGNNGFGYDPVFAPEVDGRSADRTFAQMSAHEKNEISHRARAFGVLATALVGRDGGAAAGRIHVR